MQPANERFHHGKISHDSPLRYQNVYGDLSVSDHAVVQLGDIIYGGDPTQARYRRFLDSLFFPELHAREETILAAHEGTLEWLFINEELPDAPANHLCRWLSSKDSQRNFWVRGKPGSGKSTLMSFLPEDSRCKKGLEQWALPRQIVILKHFFWELGTELQRSTVGLLRSLIWHYFAHHEDTGQELLSKLLPKENYVWTLGNLEVILEAILDIETFAFCVFLDGLDECTNTEERNQVIRLIRKLDSKPNIKVCVSSRPETKFEIAMKHWPCLRLDQMTRSDMRKFAEDELQTCALEIGISWKDETWRIAKLVQRLLDKAHGVFIWTRVAVRSLVQGMENHDDWKMLCDRLEEMPEDILNLYRHMLGRGKENIKRYAVSAAAIFDILLHQDGSMRLAQLAWACSHELRKQFLASDLTTTTIDGLLHQIDLQKLRIWIIAHCANFVEIIGPAGRLSGQPLRHNDDNIALSWIEELRQEIQPVHQNSSVEVLRAQFIHKTVAKFLRDSADGQQIMLNSPLVANTIAESVHEADLVLLLCGAAVTRSLSCDRLHQHLMLVKNIERHYDHWKLVERCLEKMERPCDDRQWYHNYLWHRSPIAVPHNCIERDGWLHYCVSSLVFTYVRRIILDKQRQLSPQCLSNLLCTFIKACVLNHGTKTELGISSKDCILQDVKLLLEAGADPNATILHSGSGVYHRWDRKVTVLVYCLWMVNFTYLEQSAFHLVLDIIQVLLENGGDRSPSVPLPLQDILKDPKLSALSTLPHYMAVVTPDLLVRLRRHIVLCSWDGCVAGSIISRMSTEVHPDKVLLLCFNRKQWYVLNSSADSDLIWEMLRRFRADVMDFSNGSIRSHYFQHYMSVLEVPSAVVPAQNDLLCAILERCTWLPDFKSALENLGWSEEDILFTMADPEFSLWYAGNSMDFGTHSVRYDEAQGFPVPTMVRRSDRGPQEPL